MNELTAELACGHLIGTTLDETFNNKLLKCFACNLPVRWVKVRDSESGWNLFCTKCPYRRSFGVAQLQAYAKARQHAARKLHDVRVRYETTVVDVLPAPAQESLDDVPPF